MSHIYDSMHEYQRAGALWGRRAGNFLLADQPGLGKTIQTLGTILATARRRDNDPAWVGWHLVVAPKVAVLNVWAPEAKRWLVDHQIEVLPLTGSNADRAQKLSEFVPRPGTRHVFVVGNIEACRVVPGLNPKNQKKDVFRPFPGNYIDPKTAKRVETGPVLLPLFQRVWDTIVVDESHRALIRTGGASSQTRGGFKLLQSKRRIALSGTPMRGKPEQLWGTLNWLEPTVYTSYWNWVKRYWVLKSNGFSDFVLGDFQHDGKARLAADLEPIMLRRTKAEVAKDLPPKTYAGYYAIEGDEDSPLGVWLEPTPAQAKQIEAFKVEGVVFDPRPKNKDTVMANGHLPQYTREKQLAGAVHHVEGETLVPTLDSAKYEWLLNWLENSGGEKIVVSSQLTSLLNVFAAGLVEEGYNVCLLTGETPDKRRTDMIERFQNTDEIQVFMLNAKAGGVALTLDAADYLVHVDESTVPDEQEQVEDRIHRISRNHNVTIYSLRILGTIEEEVAFVAAARQDVQQYILDGARGVEAARELYLQNRNQKQESK